MRRGSSNRGDDPRRWGHLCKLLLLGMLVCCGGCGRRGPELAPVTGRVTLGGEPLPDAEVEFQPLEGAPSYGSTDADGNFTLHYTRDLEGAEIGQHIVRIKSEVELVDADGETIEAPQKVPERYHNRSELRREVVRGRNHFDDLDLEP